MSRNDLVHIGVMLSALFGSGLVAALLVGRMMAG